MRVAAFEFEVPAAMLSGIDRNFKFAALPLRIRRFLWKD
jgi:hypothetical protein